MTTLARLTTWVAGDVLTAAALNNEINNIMNDYNGSITDVNIGTLADTIVWNLSSNAIAIDVMVSATTANAVSIVGNSLTTGGLLRATSDSVTTNTRSLLTGLNDNTLATGTTVLTIQQDAAQRAVFWDQNADAVTLELDTEATTANGVTVNATVMTTGFALSLPDLNALTTGRGLSMVSNSADVGTRTLGFAHNDNTAATAATVWTLRQDAARRCLFIDQDGDGYAIEIDSESTTQDCINITLAALTTGNILNLGADALTTGSLISATSNSADVSTRSLLNLVNDNVAATGATVINVRQDSNQRAVYINKAGAGGGIALEVDNTGTSSCLALRGGATSADTAGISAQNDSFVADVISLGCDRAASTAYNFIRAIADEDGDGGGVDNVFRVQGDGQIYADVAAGAGNVTIGADYVCSSCGWSSLEEVQVCPSCQGVVSWNDDVRQLVNILQGHAETLDLAEKMQLIERKPTGINMNLNKMMCLMVYGMNQLLRRIDVLEQRGSHA